MKIAYLTAGAAGMYCGSCLHDNALARALIRLGHECLLIPVYTPIRTDEENVSIDRVFMGGINVYLQQKLPWLSHIPSWLDGFLNQPWIISPLTKNAGKTSPKLLGALAVSMLQGAKGRQRKEFQRLYDWLANDIQPDVVVYTNLLIGGNIPDLKRSINPKVYVTLQGDDIFLDALPDNDRSKAIDLMKQIVPAVDGFLVHSEDYAQRMGSLLDIPNVKLHVIPLGIDIADFQQATVLASARPFTIGYLARMAPEKGLHRVVDAFIEVTKHAASGDVRLKLAGWMGPQHLDFWTEQQRKLRDAGLEERFEYVGTIDRAEKTRFLKSLDLFCVPTTYTEPKGLFLLEAIAAGVPYLQPDHGAFPELHRRVQAIASDAAIGQLFRADSLPDLCQKMLAAIENRKRQRAVEPAILDEIDIRKHAQRVLELFARANGPA
jgi:glycosyltransferase involved in cell wall biosynthesis